MRDEDQRRRRESSVPCHIDLLADHLLATLVETGFIIWHGSLLLGFVRVHRAAEVSRENRPVDISRNIGLRAVHSLAPLVEGRPAAASFLQIVHQPLHLCCEILVVL